MRVPSVFGLSAREETSKRRHYYCSHRNSYDVFTQNFLTRSRLQSMIRTWSRTRSAVMLRDKPRREFNGRITRTRHNLWAEEYTGSIDNF